ncbi:hypothetical protein PVL29_014646 [Vitis rotundifolia]|uniref:Uncharacterized protein n=1 Tax=Vitis rotundifolia TaxID=103349 RepID=A0AA38ZHD2_VITRO|nr:hypothetical protein PVL29_014646 [Vitis rotundifolia]
MVMEEKVEEEARTSESESSVSLHPHGKLLSSYLGLSFSLFLALLTSSSSISQLSTLHLKLRHAVKEIACLRAKVAKLERSEAELKAKVEELTREVGEREEMLGEDIHEPDKISPNFSLLFLFYFPRYFLRKIVRKIL